MRDRTWTCKCGHLNDSAYWRCQACDVPRYGRHQQPRNAQEVFELRAKINEMASAGVKHLAIAAELDLPEGTVAAYVRSPMRERVCRYFKGCSRAPVCSIGINAGKFAGPPAAKGRRISLACLGDIAAPKCPQFSPPTTKELVSLEVATGAGQTE